MNIIRAETIIKPINSFVFLGVFAINMQNSIDSSNSVIQGAECYYILMACTVKSQKDTAVHSKTTAVIPVKPLQAG